jgi:DNA polymerase I-like protein with 3'-5' exonuclease and polymerase domains
MAFRRHKNLGQGNDLNGILFGPQSDWTPPRDFPNLASAKVVAFDLETRDPNLEAKGPGSIRRDGYPVGFSIATDCGYSGYFPTRHLDGGNMPAEPVIRFLKDVCGNPNTEKVGANFPYDLEWGHTVGIQFRGRLHDVQAAEALIDEDRVGGYSLDALAKSYLNDGKDEALLNQAIQAYGITKSERENGKSWMWKLHSKFVGPYAAADALRTLQVFDKQKKILDSEKLWDVYDLECELMPIILKMRLKGVRVDLEKAAELAKLWRLKEDQISYDILMEHGLHLNPWAPEDIAKVAGKLQVGMPRTAKGNLSCDQTFLDSHPHPFFKQVRELRKYSKMRRDFIEGMIFENQINGRIHCQFHPLRKDEDGTRSGRFAASNPNLQQVPARDPEIGPLIRGLFIPDEGMQWAKLDYAQQEPRITTHYAAIMNLRGAHAARDAYIKNPNMDCYKYLSEVAVLPRRDTKTVFLGRSYGMGKNKLANDLGRSIEQAAEILSKFDESVPYVKELAEKAMAQVNRTGKIRAIDGRVFHFDEWIPKNKQFDRETTPIRTLAAAEQVWPDEKLVRAYTHKSLNRLIQGSAGGMTKKAIVKNYRDYGDDAVPHLTVHDELDYSVNNEDHANRLKLGMETCVDVCVPIVAELDYGKSWK